MLESIRAEILRDVSPQRRSVFSQHGRNAPKRCSGALGPYQQHTHLKSHASKHSYQNHHDRWYGVVERSDRECCRLFRADEGRDRRPRTLRRPLLARYAHGSDANGHAYQRRACTSACRAAEASPADLWCGGCELIPGGAKTKTLQASVPSTMQSLSSTLKVTLQLHAERCMQAPHAQLQHSASTWHKARADCCLLAMCEHLPWHRACGRCCVVTGEGGTVAA